MIDSIFSTLARIFPTQLIDRSRLLAMVWRGLFYALRPAQPFIMKTQYYRLVVHPKKGESLTRSVLRRGHWEPRETQAFLSFLKRGDFVIDAGANFGHYSLVASSFVGETGSVFAFEPCPHVHASLVQNVALLPLQNVSPFCAGLGEKNADMTLSVDLANPGGHSLCAQSVLVCGESLSVPVYALDEFLKEKNGQRRAVSLIKIDVQGFEHRVLLGARQTIAQDRPVVFCEVTPVSMKNIGDNIHDLLTFFKDQKYQASYIGAEGLAPLSYEEAERLLLEKDREYLDMVFVP